MTKREVKNVFQLYKSGISYRSTLEIILRIGLKKFSKATILNKEITKLAEDIIEFENLAGMGLMEDRNDSKSNN